MKVLLTAVGRRDPFPVGQDGRVDRGNLGPVLQGVAHIRPDVVYLFPTAAGDEATAEHAIRTAKELAQAGHPAPLVHVRPLALPDPTDYTAVVAQFRSEVQTVRQAHDASTIWHILLSPGAPQFRLAWSLLVLAGELPATCWEVRDPRYPGARVWEANVRFLEAPALRQRFTETWTSCDFPAAQRVARDWARRAPHTVQQARAEWVADLMSAYRYWDSVNWRGALQELRKARRSPKTWVPPADLTKLLVDQLQVLEQIERLGEEDGFWNLADLFHNARRRLRAGQHVDALTRFRRIVEGTLYASLLAQGCTIERGYAALASRLEAILATAPDEGLTARRDDAGRVYLDLPTSFLLVRGYSPLERSFTDQLQSFADHRNRTIAAHGMRPVDRKLADSALSSARKLLDTLLPGPIALDDHPFSTEAVDRMAPLLLMALDLDHGSSDP